MATTTQQLAPVGANLRAEKARWRLTYGEIGDLARMHPRQVNMYFSETRSMGGETRLKLARAMNDLIRERGGPAALFDEAYVEQ